MPTFTAAALETLIDPGDGTSPRTKTKSSSPKWLKTQNQNNVPIPRKSSRIYFSPALYTTPDPTPVPDFPASSPSPYVYNRKRRDFSRNENGNENRNPGVQAPRQAPVEEAISRPQLSPNPPIVPEAAPSSAPLSSSAHQPDGDEHHDRDDNLLSAEELVHEPSRECHLKGRSLLDDEFPSPRALMSVTSDDGGNPTRDYWRYASDMSQSEFYDAREEFSDVSSSHSSPSSHSNVEAELRAIRVNLLEEIERRKLAEQAVAAVCKQWHLIGQKMSELGISSQVIPDLEEMGLDVELAEQFCQEVVVARTVAEDMGRFCARAECEAAAEAIVNSKNHEIARLRDKLQYYEAVNQEMSLRNQEIVEMARQGRFRRKRRARWMWTCIGTSVVFGASVLAHLYLPRPGPGESLLACEDSNQRGEPG